MNTTQNNIHKKRENRFVSYESKGKGEDKKEFWEKGFVGKGLQQRSVIIEFTDFADSAKKKPMILWDKKRPGREKRQGALRQK